MTYLTSFRQKVRGLIGRYGPVTVKQHLWDAEYSSGRWNCLNDMADDCLYPIVERHANGGMILDLGCGPGATGNELDAESYRWYTGVDISEVALEKARSRSVESHRSERCEYVRADMSSYTPNRRYDVILFGDSIYYVPERNIPRMLQRYAEYLSPGGVFIARIKGVRQAWFDGASSVERGHWRRRQTVTSIIMNQYEVVERKLFNYSDMIGVLVFRPRGDGKR